MKVLIYDTTLRDGTQGEGVQMSVADKVAISRLLDDLGVAYIEGGWPGANPRDKAFFDKAVRLQRELKVAKLAAFGSTRRANVSCDEDVNLQALLKAGVPALTLFGKSWKFQATHALRISPEQNLELIEDSIQYLKARVDEVIFDAEHFFDGYAADPDYALSALRAAEAGGADYLVLCDTNGGSLPQHVIQAVQRAVGTFSKPVGIHVHNDCELAVANSLGAVEAGATMVQGTINGFGERCGNANLVSIIPTLLLKMNRECIPRERLSKLQHVAHTVYELTNRSPAANQPYVGSSAFAHKGGVHADAVKKDSRTYEHIDPQLVGNRRRILVSDLSGKASVVLKAREFGVELDADAPETQRILARLKELEHNGYQFEGAGASFKLVVDEALGKRPEYFRLLNLEVTVGLGEREEDRALAQGYAVATIEVEVGGVEAKATTRGNGPVHAMDVGLRSLIDKFYPALKTVRLLDYKVRVLSSNEGTGSVVRVLLQSGDAQEVWGTLGVSSNIIAASWQAMVDGLEYKLVKDGVEPHARRPEAVVDALAPGQRSRRQTRPERRREGRFLSEDARRKDRQAT